MTIDILLKVLGWSALINYIILVWWLLVFIFAHDLIYKVHSKWFKMSVEQFDSLHYLGLMLYKLAIFIFNLAPYLVLRLCI